MAIVLRMVYDLLSAEQRRRAVVVLLLMLVAAFFELLGVGSVLPFLSIAADPGIIERNAALRWVYTTLQFTSATSFMQAAGLAMLLIVVFMNVVSALAVQARVRFVYNVGHSISVRLMQRYLEKPYTYFLLHHTSELGKNVLAETLQIVSGVLRPGAALLSRSIIAAALVGFAFFVQPLVTLLSIGIVGGSSAAVHALIRRKLRHLGNRSVEANEGRYRMNAEAFGGIKELKALGRERHFLRAYETVSSKYAGYQAWNALYAQLPKFVIQAITYGGFIAGFVVLLASGRELSEIVPLVAFFAFAALRLLSGSQEILSSLSQFRFHEPVLFKIHSDLMQQEAQHDATEPPGHETPVLPFERQIRLEGVTFRYPGATKDVLQNLDLDVQKNSSVALVGTTGAGKTTVVDIVLGLLVPDRGALLVDGTAVTAKNAAAWRRRIGYVPQDVFLTDNTVTRNIAFGFDDREINPAAVEKAARIAHIHEFISGELPHKYETVIGERGIRLSGGQRQRIGIARALYHDPDVLVLDEATSDIDNLTEAYISEALQELAGRKTLIIIAHRLATIQRCDRIYLVEAGEIVGCGSYDELTATSPRFQRLTRAGHTTAIG